MKLIFNGHTYKYETESLCKLFFSCVKFDIEYDTVYHTTEDNYIFTRVVKGKQQTLCYAYAKAYGRCIKKSYHLLNSVDDYEKECELFLCRAVYRALEALTGITPEWGILTGVRPVKRILQHIDDGMTDTQIISHLHDRFLVSENKTKLGLLTAKTQKPILDTTDNFSYSLYVAIPFCPSRCSYCSFISQSAADSKILALVPKYLEYLFKELKATANLAKTLGLTLKTVYIGGGTPTVLTAQQITQLTKVIENYFDFSSLKEYTIEAGRPDSITESKLIAIKEAGVTRISINPQTLNDDVLNEIGRNHSAKEYFDSFTLARKIGFNNINTDLIAGLPQDTLGSFKNTVDRVVSLNPENITVHTLSYKKAARIYTNEPTNTQLSDPTGDMVAYAFGALTSSEYNPYYLYRQKNTLQNLENVGYSKKGYECMYNVYIMEETHTILANGASASTKLVNIDNGYIERVYNFKYPLDYIENFDEMLRRKNEVMDFYDKQFKTEI